MNLAKDELNAALLLNLDALFDSSHRAHLVPTTEVGEERTTLLDAYFDGFAQDPTTQMIRMVKAWLAQDWPVAIYSRLPERMRMTVSERLRALLPDVDWANGWPLNLSLHMADYQKGFYGSAVVMEAVLQCRTWGGLAVAYVDPKASDTVVKFFPESIINIA